MTETSAKPTGDMSGKIAEEKNSFLLSRRGLLQGLYVFFAAVGLGSLFYGLYRFLAPGGGDLSPVEIPLHKISEGGSYTFQYGGLPGILIQDEDGSLRAFSLVCTHLACTVAWRPEKREFFCPCHDALFDARGNVLSGPPPAPLERWNVQVKDGRVLVGTV
ncbi:MAG: Rieske (2Fe-2S) protein [Deltaproteobacteria bacterium]|nr:Rieske (2Fe-2S) protein [Deltaproteobacteria bacterium]